MSRYAGPRQFTTESAALQRELQQLASQVDQLFRAQQAGLPLRFDYADVAYRDVALVLGAITPVAVAGTFTLPAWSTTIVGQLCGLERRIASGTVSVRPPGVTLNGSTSALTLPTALRTYLFVATPLGWSTVDDG